MKEYFSATEKMKEVLMKEKYFPEEMFDFIIKEELAQRYGWLPSQVDKESRLDLELLLQVAQVKDELYPNRHTRL